MAKIYSKRNWVSINRGRILFFSSCILLQGGNVNIVSAARNTQHILVIQSRKIKGIGKIVVVVNERFRSLRESPSKILAKAGLIQI